MLALTLLAEDPCNIDDAGWRLGEIRMTLENKGIGNGALLDDSLAVDAEWIRMRDGGPKERFGHRADFFLGFLSGRFRLKLPQWWSTLVQDGREGESRIVQFPYRGLKDRWKTDKHGWYFSGIDSVVEKPEGLELAQGTRTIVLKRHELGLDNTSTKWNPDQDGAIAAFICEDVCVVALNCRPESPGVPPALYCLDRSTTKLRWKKELNHAVPLNVGITGVCPNYTEVTVDNEHIGIWTGFGLAVAVNGFRKKDGSRIGSFASSYLTGIHDATKNNKKAR
jgi:hypothetical protein